MGCPLGRRNVWKPAFGSVPKHSETTGGKRFGLVRGPIGEKVQWMNEFRLNGPYIELHKLLKVLGVAESGGGAKVLIAEGQVRVDGQVELRKGCKLRNGQVVELPGVRVRVVG